MPCHVAVVCPFEEETDKPTIWRTTTWLVCQTHPACAIKIVTGWPIGLACPIRFIHRLVGM